MIYNIRQIAGFTLIEVSIVVLLLGFVFVPLFGILAQQNLDERKVENISKHDRIVTALNFYLKQNGAYPCGADMDVAPGDAAFGVADCSLQLLTMPNLMKGAIPVVDLGLPYDLSVNEHGWKYIYFVTEELTQAASFDGTGRIIVGDESGNQTTGVHFVVVDPGEDGKGSFSLDGGGNPYTGTSPCTAAHLSVDTENCDYDDNIFVSARKSLSGSPTSAGYYDDTLLYNNVDNKSDLFVARSSGVGGDVEVASRVDGNIGLGAVAPPDKLTVEGDVVIERQGPLGGDLHVRGGQVNVTNTLTADRIEVTGYVLADQLCQGGRAYGADLCCYPPNALYKELDNSNQIVETCGAECPNANYLLPEVDMDGSPTGNTVCCRRSRVDFANAQCRVCRLGEVQDALGACCAPADVDPTTGWCP